MFGFFRRSNDVRGQEQAIEGAIIDVPTTTSEEGQPSTLRFHLDSRPDLEFWQVDSPLTPRRRRGDRVRVHCRLNGSSTVKAEWVERIGN